MTEWRLNCYDGKAYTLPNPVAWRLDYGLGSPCDSFWVKTLWSVGQEETLAAGTRMQVFHDGALCFVGVVDVKVMAPETVTVDLILSVKPKEGLLPGPVIDRVKAALRAWFDGSLLGQDVLLAQIGQKIFAVDGVANYQIQGPVNDVTVGRGQLPVLGKLSVEELR